MLASIENNLLAPVSGLCLIPVAGARIGELAVDAAKFLNIKNISSPLIRLEGLGKSRYMPFLAIPSALTAGISGYRSAKALWTGESQDETQDWLNIGSASLLIGNLALTQLFKAAPTVGYLMAAGGLALDVAGLKHTWNKEGGESGHFWLQAATTLLFNSDRRARETFKTAGGRILTTLVKPKPDPLFLPSPLSLHRETTGTDFQSDRDSEEEAILIGAWQSILTHAAVKNERQCPEKVVVGFLRGSSREADAITWKQARRMETPPQSGKVGENIPVRQTWYHITNEENPPSGPSPSYQIDLDTLTACHFERSQSTGTKLMGPQLEALGPSHPLYERLSQGKPLFIVQEIQTNGSPTLEVVRAELNVVGKLDLIRESQRAECEDSIMGETSDVGIRTEPVPSISLAKVRFSPGQKDLAYHYVRQFKDQPPPSAPAKEGWIASRDKTTDQVIVQKVEEIPPPQPLDEFRERVPPSSSPLQAAGWVDEDLSTHARRLMAPSATGAEAEMAAIVRTDELSRQLPKYLEVLALSESEGIQVPKTYEFDSYGFARVTQWISLSHESVREALASGSEEIAVSSGTPVPLSHLLFSRGKDTSAPTDPLTPYNTLVRLLHPEGDTPPVSSFASYYDPSNNIRDIENPDALKKIDPFEVVRLD